MVRARARARALVYSGQGTTADRLMVQLDKTLLHMMHGELRSSGLVNTNICAHLHIHEIQLQCFEGAFNCSSNAPLISTKRTASIQRGIIRGSTVNVQTLLYNSDYVRTYVDTYVTAMANLGN